MVEGRFGVLVVDDEPDLLHLIRLLLELEDRLEVVAVAGCGEEAMQAATDRTEQIDLVVVDQYLPGPVSGLDVARHVRQACPRAKVLLFTADDRADAATAAVDAVVRKPDLDQLPAVALRLVQA